MEGFNPLGHDHCYSSQYLLAVSGYKYLARATIIVIHTTCLVDNGVEYNEVTPDCHRASQLDLFRVDFHCIGISANDGNRLCYRSSEVQATGHLVH